jgi:hypothetical protein|tara:strand:+ start:77 stop:412 length:336 start_codon:yes stop_codon:yes gene_type:complete
MKYKQTNKTQQEINDDAYWDREYSGDIELGRAKLRIKELEQELTSFNHLKSISWNLNRIANVLEEVVPNNKTVSNKLNGVIKKDNTGSQSLRDLIKNRPVTFPEVEGDDNE